MDKSDEAGAENAASDGRSRQKEMETEEETDGDSRRRSR